MRTVAEANKYLSDQEPWKRKDDPERRDTILHTALQVVQDANTLLTPFLPHSAQQVHEALGGTGTHMSSQISTCSTKPVRSVAVNNRSGPNGTSASPIRIAPRTSSPAAIWRFS